MSGGAFILADPSPEPVEGRLRQDLTGYLSGRIYYAKRAGWRWQVWFAYQDGSDDASSGATEWLACTVRYWKWLHAERAALAMWQAFNAGVWCADGRHDLHREPKP